MEDLTVQRSDVVAATRREDVEEAAALGHHSRS